ncbi:hypothetical protein JCM10450v2_005681 [Rhodotorula kratochvilovae]
MPAVLLSRRQDPPASSTQLAQTSATRFLPAASSTASSGSGSGDGSDTGVSIWKYAIVVLLCVFALGALLRLGFIHRLRRQRAAALYAQHAHPHTRPRRQPAQPRRESQHSLNGSVYSLDLDDVRVEPPPPAYDDAAAPPPAPAAVPVSTQEPRPSPARRGPLARFSSLFHRRSMSRTDVLPLEQLPAPSLPASAGTHATRPADPATLAEVAHLRRALRDAGLLVAPPRVGGSLADLTPAQRAALQGASPSVLAAAAAMAGGAVEEEEERRRRRRERRRRRREREAQRERDEGLGLPTYSRKVADGEEVLQRAEGFKTDGSEDDSGESGDEGALEGVRRGSAVVPVLERQPRASTSSAAVGQGTTALPSHGEGRSASPPQRDPSARDDP